VRAKEFLNEVKTTYSPADLKKGKVPHNFKDSSVGTIRNSGYYDLYRATLVMAGHPDNEHDVDPSSWAGPDGCVTAYSEEEREMARSAFRKLGIDHNDETTNPSHESDAVNNTSPVKPFKGYKR